MLRTAACLLIVLGAAACSSSSGPAASDSYTATDRYSMTGTTANDYTASAGQPAHLDPTRPIADRDCSKPIEVPGGNLRCR